MTDATVIQHTTGATATVDTIRMDLVALGIEPGQTLLVHSSLSSIGWVSGGPVSVIIALQSVLGDSGTLVMPTHTSYLGDPALWRHPAAIEHSVDTIRATLPAFDPLLTPSRGMGVIPECFRSQTGVVRSNHPHDSFAAGGPCAQEIVSDHALNDGLGEQSPLATLYKLDAQVLLLGVDHASSTSLHLAENRADYAGKRYVNNGGPVAIANQRQWAAIRHLEYQINDFNRIGHSYARDTGEMSYGYIGRGQSMLFPMRGMVDYAVHWMEQNR